MKILLTYRNKDGKRIFHRFGTNTRVLAQRIASDKFYKANLKVSYGKKEDTFGKLVEFTNEGDYFTKKDLQQAFRAFTEK